MSRYIKRRYPHHESLEESLGRCLDSEGTVPAPSMSSVGRNAGEVALYGPAGEVLRIVDRRRRIGFTNEEDTRG